jgi:hypothetical protein
MSKPESESFSICYVFTTLALPSQPIGQFLLTGSDLNFFN